MYEMYITAYNGSRAIRLSWGDRGWLRGNDMPKLLDEGNIAAVREHHLDDLRSEWRLFLEMNSRGVA